LDGVFVVIFEKLPSKVLLTKVSVYCKKRLCGMILFRGIIHRIITSRRSTAEFSVFCYNKKDIPVKYSKT